MTIRLIASLGIAVALLTTGCAAFRASSVTPGTNANDVRAQLGAPSDERKLASGITAWDYVYGPLGFTTWRVNFDANNRVTGVEQLLTEQRFSKVAANELDRDGVRSAFGRPGQVSSFPNLSEEVWTYRYMDVTTYRLADVHFDTRSGRAKYISLYHDPAYCSTYDQ